MRVSFAWLQSLLPSLDRDAPAVAELLTMAGIEVEAVERHGDDTVLILNVTANRPDCLSMIGVARDVAAAARLTGPTPSAALHIQTEGRIETQLTVVVQDPSACPRYTARYVRIAQLGATPSWAQHRLLAAGIRPVNAVVDATNYVMLELGHPLHAFDARCVHDRKIVVERAPQHRTFRTLDGVERTLHPEDLLICDGTGPIALGGIMGGANSEIRDDTREVILECAYFTGRVIRRTSRRLGLQSESSRRFERGVDPNGVVAALHRVTELICAWCHGTATTDWIDVYPQPIAPATCRLGSHHIQRLLGLPIPSTEVEDLLQRLGCTCRPAEGGWLVTIPTARPDLTRPVDLIEEVARLYGYGRIPSHLPAMVMAPVTKPRGTAWDAMCRERLIAHGFVETVHHSFGAAARLAGFAYPGRTSLPLANPLGSEPLSLKTSLTADLIQTCAHNLRQGAGRLRLFELHATYWQEQGEAREATHLGLLMTGPRAPKGWTNVKDVVDFFDIKGVVDSLMTWAGGPVFEWQRPPTPVESGNAALPESMPQTGFPAFLHPGRSALLRLHGDTIGYCGELHPRLARDLDAADPIYLMECLTDPLEAAYQAPIQSYRPMVRHPSVQRDVALLVPATIDAAEVVAAVRRLHHPWITDVTLFDVYCGDRLPVGHKSVALAIVYQDPNRTLTDDEVNRCHHGITTQLSEQFQAQVRGNG